MELKLEVVLSSSIKRKKPWPRFCWLGQEKESVFLLDDKRISEVNMVSGRTKKRTPKLHPLLNSVVTMASSHSGTWLCGLMVTGELFMWNRDKDLLKTAAAVPEVVHLITSAQGRATRLSLQVSGDGKRVLLVAITGQVFLWECMDVRDLTKIRDGTVKGRWAHIKPLEDTALPSPQDKEASQHTIFVKTEAVGDACFSALVFTSGIKLVISCLKIQWEEGHMRVGSFGYGIQWTTKTYILSRLTPPCQPVKSRGALLPAFSPDGQLLAIVLNQRQPKATQVLYVSTQNFVSVSTGLGGCGIKKVEIPSKYIRSYWVGNVSWSASSLFLACVLKRGSLLMLARLAGLLTLTTSGCNVDFGPAHFLPLHPLVTYRPPVSAGKEEASLSCSSVSARDVLRQRYSVTWHPRLLYLIVSDGYMATVMRVLDRPTPAALMKSLLKDTSKELERASRMLDQSLIPVRAWLESVSCLNLDSSIETLDPIPATDGPNTTDYAPADGSTLPLFLQDQGTFGGTRELLEKVQNFLDDDSDLEGPPAGSHVEDGGRLEFASMFDTLHAHDTHTVPPGPVTGPEYGKDFVEKKEGKTPLLHRELGKVQSKLLTAWAFSMSLGNKVEHRGRLLKLTLFCVVRLAALLHLIHRSKVHKGKKKTPVSTHLLHLIKALLSFLPWDGTHSDGPCCLGPVVELSRRLVCLLLTPLPVSSPTAHCQLSSQSLSTALRVLQLVSECLDKAYSLRQKTVWSPAEQDSLAQLWPSDVHYVPLLKDEREKKLASLHQTPPVPQRPSSRLFGVWQWVYKITQQYLEELKGFEGCDGWQEERQQMSFLMSQIQTALQATGERLEEGPALLTYPGEHLFLCGSYEKSADAWRSQMCEESNKNGDRRVFQQERLCLALLYSLLSQYRLREAQELGDHMARLILYRAGHQRDNIEPITASFPCTWLPADLCSDAAWAVVHSLGRFMASYFTNRPLHIPPPHNVAVLPPLYLPHGAGRLVPLCQEEVAAAVRRQHLSEVWTVDYAQDLLLLGGLLPEAVWLAYHLGDRKTAVSLSLAYTKYCTDHFDFAGLRMRELQLPKDLEAENIFQSELECLLGNKPESQDYNDQHGDRSFTEPLEGEDWDLLLGSMREILKASVMAGVNVTSSPLASLLDTAKDRCSCFPMLVPSGLYLPSPPLYCPQPSPSTEDLMGTVGQCAEVASRHKVSGVLQRLLLLLRSARCCHPAAQWYITHLRRARHLLHKIKRKYSYPGSAEEEEKAFPEGLMKFVAHGGFFRRGPNKDGRLDPDAIQTILCFRELCGLCWMLHVRDRLSIACRKYQAARQTGRNEQILCDSEVRSSCVEALRWARRFLPFSRFLNAEEILQDLLLSLVSELPPSSLVADILVCAFPAEEESVRVPLREKYNSLLQRLRPCSVLEGEKGEEGPEEELMMIVIQDKRRQRRKHLGRLRRHLAPAELHLWEKEEEEEDRGSKQPGMAVLQQLSMGTTLSTSTLTDGGFPPVCSEGDTAENTSEAISPEQPRRSTTRNKKTRNVRAHAVRMEKAIPEEAHQGDTEGNEKCSLPVVGTWEFELEDDEFLNFLELFLSYELEKDDAGGGDPGGELPLLKSFSSQLRKRELHSLTFDVLTTLHRRQRDGYHPGKKACGGDPPVFRAGCSYRPLKHGATSEPQTPSIWSEGPVSRTSLSAGSFPGLSTGRPKGLFGRPKPSGVTSAQRANGGQRGSESSPVKSAFPVWQPSESAMFGSSAEAVVDLQQGLDPQLEARFPELGRLLEWMVRWADRRVLPGHHGKKKTEERGGGVVIRVKASTPAVLTSLSFLEWRYAPLLGSGRPSDHVPVPDAQWMVAPVLQPVGDGKLERESSIDTGYPGSANTPITGFDHNLQQEQLSTGSGAEEPEEPTCQRMPLLHDQDQMEFHTMAGQSRSQQPPLDDLNITPEKEGKSSGSEEWEVSSSVWHENVSESVCPPGVSLKLADLAFSENVEDISSSSSLSPQAPPQAPPQPETQALPILQPKASVHTEVTDSIGASLPNTSVDPPRLRPPSSMACGLAAASTAPNQPSSTQSPPMRNRLGEDLFRLVQNINYMCMMEMLGTSFSNLQLAQESSSLAQSNMNVPPSCVTNAAPQPNASVAPQTQAGVQPSGSNKAHFSRTSATHGRHHLSRNLSTAATGVGGNDRELHPLSVYVESPEMQRQSRRLIPTSQGLLATTDFSQPAPAASMGGVQNETATPASGLKLLQFQYPPLPQPSAPHCPPAQEPPAMHAVNPATLKSHHQAASRRAEQAGRTMSSFQRRQLGYDHPHYPAPRNAQPHIPAQERPGRQEFSSFHPASQTHTPAPLEGLRLLKLQPAEHRKTTLPELPIPLSSRPPSVIAAPIGETAQIKLLQIESGPKMIMPLAAPSTPVTRPLSMDELTGPVVRRQYAEEARLRLLRVDPPTESTRTATTSPRSCSSKRQRRRKDVAGRAGKTEVTFRPNESIIPPTKSSEEPLYYAPDEPAAATDIAPQHNFPIASLDSLTGQSLLSKAVSTSAELHAFASTCKKPPECHDAFTNTDSVRPPTLVDKNVSTSVTSTNPKSQRSWNEHLVQDLVEETPVRPDRDRDLHGHQFISVLDLEDDALHQDLRLRPGEQDLPSVRPSSPTSAQLHVLATSIFKTADAPDVSDPQPQITNTDDPLNPTAHPGGPEDSRSHGRVDSDAGPERITSRDVAGPSNSRICQAIKMESAGRRCTSSSPPAAWFSSCLSEQDAQLAALQKIADRLERDFSNSGMMVNSIEEITPDFAPYVRSSVAGKKTVRLSVPQEAWTPQTGTKKSQDDKHVVHRDSHTPEGKAHLTPPHNHRAGPPNHQSFPRTKDHLAEASGISEVWEDETLSQSGLSDTAEILDELIREGYLSPPDMDLSTSQPARPISSMHEQQRSTASQRSVLAEDKRELRNWMRKKQRERMAVFQEQRERLRQKELKPFCASANAKPTNRKQASVERKNREESGKSVLLEQYNQRIVEACSLASGLSPAPPVLRSSSQPEGPLGSTPRPFSTPLLSSTYRIPKSMVGPTQPPRPWTADVQGRSSELHCRRLGLHRPVTSLPRDRLSQVTRRGMITDTKSHTEVLAAGQSEERHAGNSAKTQLNKRTVGGTAVGKGIQRGQKKTDDGAEVNIWKPTSELNEPLSQEGSESNLVLSRLLDVQHNGAQAGVSGLDSLSESASSCLSKIDWAAIERMVAAEED